MTRKFAKRETLQRRFDLMDRSNAALTKLAVKPVFLSSLDRLSLADAEDLTATLEELATKAVRP